MHWRRTVLLNKWASPGHLQIGLLRIPNTLAKPSIRFAGRELKLGFANDWSLRPLTICARLLLFRMLRVAFYAGPLSILGFWPRLGLSAARDMSERIQKLFADLRLCVFQRACDGIGCQLSYIVALILIKLGSGGILLYSVFSCLWGLLYLSWVRLLRGSTRGCGFLPVKVHFHSASSWSRLGFPGRAISRTLSR